MRPIRSISILLPTHQGIRFLPRLLDALASQTLDRPFDVHAIDTASTDGTFELLAKTAETFPVPLRVERIHPVEFDHGDTRNVLAARSTGDLLVYLTQDAIPTSPTWLQTLARNFDDPRVGAATCRNLARPDADLLTRVFCENDPGYQPGRRETRIEDRAAYAKASPLERRLLYNFNDVASAIRRELWELHPFPRTSFGEDVLMARAILEAGYTVVYDDQATVEHSHDFTPEETRARAEIDGRFNAEWLDRLCFTSRAQAREHVPGQVEKDLAALRASGEGEARLAEETRRAVALRTAAFEGLWVGGRSPLRRPSTRLLERRDLKVLYVVHGFPPDTWAGTEVYTLNLARAIQRRGHRVAVLARAPASKSVAEGGPADFTVREDAFEGLRVLRMTHRLEHRSLRDTFERPEAEAAFEGVLDAEQPDLVHFMHLIHLSAGLVEVARGRGLPTVITCHDFWSICPRVQLIRPDGVRCEENMGSGCLPCVKDKNLGRIEGLKRLDASARPLLAALGEGRGIGRLAPAGLRRRFEGFADLRDRHEAVLAAYAAADLRVSPSRFLRQKLVETAGLDPGTFLFSDNGMRTESLENFRKRPDPEGRVRFGFVGSLVWYKGAEVMLRAMKRLQGTRAVLSIHGDFDPECDPHHAALAKLAGPNVSFRGRFDNARLSEVYSGLDVLLVPSIWWENSPITIHEAFLTRTPVVASGIGGMAEYVRDGVDGLHFAVGDDADLAAKMSRFLDEPDLAGRLGKNAPVVKTIDDDAAVTETRYRALCCVVREAGESAGGGHA
jgi:glycosyltransferase involved in cell wall biosynthesis